MTTGGWDEDELVDLLSSVLLNNDNNDDDEIDGLDEDLMRYISGLLSTQLQDFVDGSGSDPENNNNIDSILDEALVPFLDSVACPSELIERAKDAVVQEARKKAQSASNGNASGTSKNNRGTDSLKLRQGMVTMSSTLSEELSEGDRYMWGTDGVGDMKKLHANANIQKDAYHEKSSAKERRKQRQELERSRREFEKQQAGAQEEHNTKAGVSSMILPTVKGKDMDINVQNITLSLDNGTSLLESGDLKFAYKRRYAIIGENVSSNNAISLSFVFLVVLSWLLSHALLSPFYGLLGCW